MTVVQGILFRMTTETAGVEKRLDVFVAGIEHPPTRAQWGGINTAVDGAINHADGERLVSLESVGAFKVVTL